MNVAGDSTVEPSENFTVALSNPSAGTTIGTATATGTILNDDTAPGPSLSIAAANASLNEGNSGSTAFTFTVTRTGSTTGASTASYAVTGSGANPATAADFTGGAFPTGTVSFAAGETSKTITVNVAGDATVEPNENFTVTLSNPSAGTTIGTAAATSTILNDDSSATPTLVTAVNVGGGQVTASNGVVFQADAGPTTGGAASQVFSTTAGIAGTTDDALFQDERWTPGGSYTYEIAVANGTYQVDLLLAEIYSGITGPGQRVFDMSLEGQALAALQNIDVYAQVGANAAYTISQQVTVNDGSLSIQVGPGSSSPGNVENAKLNAFAVYSTAAPTSPTLSIAAASASQNEGNSGSTAFTFTVTRTGSTAGASTRQLCRDRQRRQPGRGGRLHRRRIADRHGELRRRRDQQDDHGERRRRQQPSSPPRASPLTLSNPSAGTTIGTATATGTILNDDTAAGPSLSIAAANASLNEGNSGSTAFTFTVTRTGSTTAASTASYAVTGSGANSGRGRRLHRRRLPDRDGELRGRRDQQDHHGERRGRQHRRARQRTSPSRCPIPAPARPSARRPPPAPSSTTTAAAARPSARLLITPGTDSQRQHLCRAGLRAHQHRHDRHPHAEHRSAQQPDRRHGVRSVRHVRRHHGARLHALRLRAGERDLGVRTEPGHRRRLQDAGRHLRRRRPCRRPDLRVPSRCRSRQHRGAVARPQRIGLDLGLRACRRLGHGRARSMAASIGGEVFTQGSAGGGMATLGSSLPAAPVLSMSTVGGTPLVTDAVGGILKANLPGLNAGAGSPGNDVVVEISGTAGQTVRLAVSEIGGVGMDIPLGSHEGNTVLQNPSFVDVTLGAGGTASVALALPAETPTGSLAGGSVSGRFAVTAAAVDPATGAAISQVSSTLVVKDAANSFTSDAASDTFIFRQGFATTDVFQFSATGGSHDFIGLDQDLFPGMTIQQVLNSNALQPGAGAGDVDIVPASGGEVHLHDSSGQLTVDAAARQSPGLLR